MEALSRMMTVTVDGGLLSRFLVGARNNDELLVCHLLFVDDTLIFCESNCDLVICVVYSYVLKWGWRLICLNQN